MGVLGAKAKWWALAALALLLGVLWYLSRRGLPAGGPEHGRLPASPLRAAAERAHEEALVREAVAKAKADEHRTEIEAIRAVDDGAERRRRLAALAKRL